MEGNLSIKEKKSFKEVKFVLNDSNLSYELKEKKVDDMDLEYNFTGLEKISDTSFIIGPTVDGDYFEINGSKEEIEKWFNKLSSVIQEKKEQEFHNIDESTKEGWINVYKDKKSINRYCELFEGTFRIFSSPEKGSKNFRSEVYLFNATVTSNAKQITITPTGESRPIELIATLNTEVESWVKAIKQEIEIAKNLGVQGNEKKKTGIGARMKKGIGQKLATSKSAKKILNKEATDLLSSLHKVVTAHSGIKKADDIEKGILRILTKMYFAISNKQVAYEEFLKADKPLREAFKIVSLIWGGRLRVEKGKDPKIFIQEFFQNVQKYWKEVENVIIKNLTPIVKTKNLQLIRDTLTFLRDPEFIRFVAKSDELEDARLELEMSMDGYCSIELSEGITFD
eukprot:TRINITY_DN1042_c0_g1_i1.p1 TRINITY_DN1042_c0_g1~~TRINITY_DN1042_c0_g1_i1.p1  ORF type:complete len:397 (-),score=136.57 TRINITY_DN1042_c0_g1_i1:144-1334(-)